MAPTQPSTGQGPCSNWKVGRPPERPKEAHQFDALSCATSSAPRSPITAPIAMEKFRCPPCETLSSQSSPVPLSNSPW